MISYYMSGREQTAYRLLHDGGHVAFDEQYPVWGTDLINKWADAGIIKVTYPEGSLTVQTYAKYAKCTGCNDRPRHNHRSTPCPTCGR